MLKKILGLGVPILIDYLRAKWQARKRRRKAGQR